MGAVLQAVLPIFGLIGLGVASGRLGLFSREAADSLNRFAIFLALPALIFGVMSRVTPAEIGEAGFLGAFTGGMAVAAAGGFLHARWRRRSVAVSSLEALDAGYANVGFMGIPLCLLVFGPDSGPPAVLATLLVACGLFLGAIVAVEADLGRGAGMARTLRRVGGSLGRNPLFLAPVAGLAFGLGGVALPVPAERFVSLLGGAASPVALICIGLFLAHEPLVSDDWPTVATLVGLKLVGQPAVTAALAFGLFSMPPVWAKAAVLLAALPIGTGPFTVAKLYRLPAGVTSGAILVSHVLSVGSVSVLVALLA